MPKLTLPKIKKPNIKVPAKVTLFFSNMRSRIQQLTPKQKNMITAGFFIFLTAIILSLVAVFSNYKFYGVSVDIGYDGSTRVRSENVGSYYFALPGGFEYKSNVASYNAERIDLVNREENIFLSVFIKMNVFSVNDAARKIFEQTEYDFKNSIVKFVDSTAGSYSSAVNIRTYTLNNNLKSIFVYAKKYNKFVCLNFVLPQKNDEQDVLAVASQIISSI